MGFLDLFRRKPIADVDALVSEIGRGAAFLVNKGMYEYARARSGVLSDKLLREKAFQDAVEIGRWTAYPYAVGYLTEMYQGLLRPGFEGRELELADAMVAVARRAMLAHPLPDHIAPADWALEADRLEARLRTAFLAGRKAVRHIPDATARAFFDAFPMHETVKQHDFEVISNHLRSLILFQHDKALPRLNHAALAADLSGLARTVQPGR